MSQVPIVVPSRPCPAYERAEVRGVAFVRAAVGATKLRHGDTTRVPCQMIPAKQKAPTYKSTFASRPAKFRNSLHE